MYIYYFILFIFIIIIFFFKKICYLPGRNWVLTYIMIQNHEYYFYKLFVPHQFDFVGIVKFEDVFFGSRSNEFLNSLYVSIGTLEICFSLS